ncbi:MAG: patatin-like phospholipase family protein, partial [Longimicrobiales bacterium]
MLHPSHFAIAVEHMVAPLRRELAGKEFSDILDAEGHQYVDLVLEGGGMLGIALVGYTYVLEQAGIRFLRLGGTSAGAINALLLAALESREHAKTDEVVRLLANQNFYEFVDGDRDARRVIESALRGGGLLSMLYAGVQVQDKLDDDWGLNPGAVFYEWLRGHLHAAGIHTWADLRTRLTAGELVRR